LADLELEALRATGVRRRADEWVLVLNSQGIACALQPERGAWVLQVAAADRAAAELALTRWERENAAPPARPPLPALPPGRGVMGVWVGGALALFAVVTGPAADATRWFRRGTAHAAALLGGEPWRAVTALTLHVDAAHVVSNALACGIFVTWTCRRLGNGLGLAALLLAGALGNAGSALWHGGAHRAVGASSALFGALGILSGVEAGCQWQAGAPIARAWLPLAAGLALLAMLGTGRGSDVAAHLFGLGAGGLLGLPLSIAALRPPGAAVQYAAGALALGSVVGAWALALSA